MHGTWSGAPSAYAYRGRTADSSGANCSAISGAAQSTYTLGAGNVGHTIRVQEAASNPAGTGATVVSAPTAVVSPASILSASTAAVSLGSILSTSTASTPPSTEVRPPHGVGKVTIGRVRVSVTTASVLVNCSAAGPCTLTLTLLVTEEVRSGKVAVGMVAASKRRVVVGRAFVTIAAGGHQIVKVGLNRTGRKLLAKHDPLRTKLAIAEGRKGVASLTVTFKLRNVGHSASGRRG